MFLGRSKKYLGAPADYACNRKKHITGTSDIIEERYGILLTTQGKKAGHKACYDGSPAQWRTQKLFMGGGFIQRHRVVICIWCALFVTSQNDVIVLLPNQRFGEVC